MKYNDLHGKMALKLYLKNIYINSRTFKQEDTFFLVKKIPIKSKFCWIIFSEKIVLMLIKLIYLDLS